MFTVQTGVVKTGGFRYDDSTRYIGDWNQKGQKHGMGHLLLPDGTRYGKEKLVPNFSLQISMRNKIVVCDFFSSDFKMDLL